MSHKPLKILKTKKFYEHNVPKIIEIPLNLNALPLKQAGILNATPKKLYITG